MKPYNEVINWLEIFFQNKSKVNFYRGFEYSYEFKNDIVKAQKKSAITFSVDPMLPVDCISVRKTKRKTDDPKIKKENYNYYQLFWIAFGTRDDLVGKLQFYRFYLSRISKSNIVEIIIICNDKKENLSEIIKIANDNGFGLWNIDLSKNDPDEIVMPLDYRERMSNVLKNPGQFDSQLEVFPPEVTARSKDLALFFDSFISESLEAMVGISAKHIGKRCIERKVLDFVFDLKNISYREELMKLVSEHLINKSDDYNFVESVFSKLFKTCGVNTEYSQFLRKFEAPLYNIFSASKEQYPYRDHYFHQFQVFLLGLRIIDRYYSSLSKGIEKQWLITASFHDIAYPIQKFDSWAKKFFSESIDIPDLGVADMSKHFVSKSLLTCTTDIISSICATHFPEKNLNGNWLRKENRLIEIYHKIITESKHHGLLSSIYLLKEADRLKKDGLITEEIFEELFRPAAMAISLHHNIKYTIKELENKQKEEYLWDELNSYGLKIIDSKKDFLSFLLIFCDSAQEWGRPSDYPAENHVGNETIKNFFLQEFKIDDSKCWIKLKANFPSNDEIFKFKMNELDKVSNFLKKCKGVKYQITIIDSNDEKKDFFIKGE